MITVECAVCASAFQAVQRHAKYCSEPCRNLAERRNKPASHVCEVCGMLYRRSYPRQRTCGRKCGAVINPMVGPDRPRRVGCLRPPRRLQSPPPQPKPPYVGSCRNCGETFTSAHHRACCSRRCADKDYNSRRRVNTACGTCACGVELPARNRHKCDGCLVTARADRKRRERQRVRRIKRGVAVEAYTLRDIAERDRYRCGLCKRRVPMDRRVPHPKAATIDHVVPLAAGGDDTKANVQLAHFMCNCLKSDRGGPNNWP